MGKLCSAEVVDSLAREIAIMDRFLRHRVAPHEQIVGCLAGSVSEMAECSSTRAWNPCVMFKRSLFMYGEMFARWRSCGSSKRRAIAAANTAHHFNHPGRFPAS